MTPLTLKWDNPSVECNGHSVQVVGTLQVTTTPDTAALVAQMFGEIRVGDIEKPAKRKALAGREK